MNDRRVPSAAVAVIGAGYVGLATAVALAHFGHRVVCADVDEAKVARLAAGQPTVVEDGLSELLGEQLAAERLRFVTSARSAVPGAQFVFLCLPTPQRPDGSADVSALQEVAREIGPLLDSDAVVVTKSTVPVGSTQVVEALLARPDVTVVSNPEFLREGRAVHDCLHPDRVVVGAADPGAAARVGALFKATGAPLVVTDSATAELIKYASNAYLATRLSFVNAVASLAERVGADVRDVLLGMGYDHRIGFDYLRPGPGWGGSCLPKDTAALRFLAEQVGYRFDLLDAAVATNEAQLASIVDKVRRAAGGDLADQPVAVWGLTFKAGTDDRRASPAVDIVRRLVDAGARVRAHDPAVTSPLEELPAVTVDGDPYAACHGARCLVLLTEWDQFRWADFEKVGEMLRDRVVVDARNVLDPAQLRRLGFSYTGVGRP